MRARNVITSGLLAAVLAACSKPPADAALDVHSTLAAELELALFSAPTTSEVAPSVVSEVERTPLRPVRSSRPERETSLPAARPEPVVRLLGQPALAAEPVEEPVPAAAPIIESVAAAGGGSEHGDHDLDAPRRGRARPTIIRGGVTGRDPCAIHLPGRGGSVDTRGTIGVLINDRAPRNIGLYNPSLPRRGGTASPRGGGVFPGGIR